jgi:preprotein translocase subunit SecG
LNILAGVFLIGVVLLQSGKGADMGAAFGGSSTTVFGASGAGNLLTKITAATAAVFMGTSLILAVISTRDQSVFANAPEPEAAAAPAAAAPPPPDGQPTDGVDAKAAAEARGQEPLVADETDLPKGDAAPAGDLGPAGAAGEQPAADVLGQASPPASDEHKEAEGAVGGAPGEPAAAPTGQGPAAPEGGAVANPTGSAVTAPAGNAPANPTGATPPNPAGAAPKHAPAAGAHP